MYYTNMRWQMTALMAAYFFTLGYGLQQLRLFWRPHFPLVLAVGGFVLGLALSPLPSKETAQASSGRGATRDS